MDSTCIQYTDLVDGRLTTNCIDLENTIETGSIISESDDTSKYLTGYESDTGEIEDQFEIAILNNEQLKMKKIQIL